MPPRHPPPDGHLIERREILDRAGIARALRRIAHEIVEKERGGSGLYLVGIHTGGAFLARRLAALLTEAGAGHPRLGAIDIALYRDDVFRGLAKPEVGPTDLPGSVDGQVVTLVDDVLYTGRTVRAALDVLADYGRPRAVRLVALVDRGRRELPIQPDYVGVTVQTTEGESVRVMLEERGEPDRVVLRERSAAAAGHPGAAT